MAIVNTFDCDQCHVQQQPEDAAAWFKAFLLKGKTADQQLPSEQPIALVIVNWEYDVLYPEFQPVDGLGPDKAHAHLCSVKCAQDYFANYINKMSERYKTEKYK